MKKSLSIKLTDSLGNRLYVVTDKISGNISGKIIVANRGDKVYLSADAAKVFKDRIIEV